MATLALILAYNEEPSTNQNISNSEVNSKINNEVDTTKKLLDLKKLYNEGIISEEEYNEKREGKN